jgi:hypothetical protein
MSDRVHRFTVYACLDCDHRSRGDIRSAALDAVEHQADEHGRLFGWRNHVHCLMEIEPEPVQARLW